MTSRKQADTPLPDAVKAIVGRISQRSGLLDDSEQVLIGVYRAVVDVFEQGGILYICGNGGSFADAIHIKAELTKSFERPRPITDPKVKARLKGSKIGAALLENLEVGLPVVVLGESHGLRSAYENDRDPIFSYAQELNAFAGHLKTGALLGISTSGNAKNVIAAMTLAKAYELVTISFTGPDGGQLAQTADIALRVPGDCTARIQENQIPLYHTLCRMIEAHFFNAS
jgi:D-sedoheptulose 7-phosphate isomerase